MPEVTIQLTDEEAGYLRLNGPAYGTLPGARAEILSKLASLLPEPIKAGDVVRSTNSRRPYAQRMEVLAVADQDGKPVLWIRDGDGDISTWSADGSLERVA